MLVTGRRHPSARRVADDLGGVVPLVLHNGALVIEEGEVLRCRAAAARGGATGRPRGPRPGRSSR